MVENHLYGSRKVVEGMDKTDKVLKGLECCGKKYPCNAWCKYCPYEPDCCHDSTCDLLIHDAISVIKEQQAEIERLKSKEDALEQMRLDNQDLRQCNSEMMAEIERLKDEVAMFEADADPLG